MKLIFSLIGKYSLHLAWLVALTGLLGSLYLSEIRNYPLCLLCWYQRITLYPLAILLPLGIIRKDPNIAVYALALTLIGFGFSAYHNLLYFDLIGVADGVCRGDIPCEQKLVSIFGLDIPQLSLIANILIIIILYLGLIKKPTNS